MAQQWEEEQHMEDIVEGRRMEGSSFKLGAVQKVPELVVNERMSQGTRVTNPKDEEKVPGWSTEEMKEKPNFAVEDDTEEMKKWRELNQIEIDICWKKLAERMEEEVLDKVGESRRGAFEGRGDPLFWRKVRKNKRCKKRKWREECWARIFSLLTECNSQRLQSKQEDLTEEKRRSSSKGRRS